MKKILSLFVLTCAFAAVIQFNAFAATAAIDTTGSSKGIVAVNITDAGGKSIKAQVEKGGDKYVYTLIKSSVNLPLQMGAGEYKVTVLENIGGDKYKPLASALVNASSIDENELYKASIPTIEYSASTRAIPAYRTLTSGKSVEADKIAAIYEDIVKNYVYDYSKAATVAAGYVPVIDTTYDEKKGICYDYSAIFGGTLRSQGIPTKLVMGYAPEIAEYHAWNEVLISGKWVAVDTTFDAQLVKAGKSYAMSKDKAKRKVVKVY